jgi:hypothetical protein
MDDYQQTLDRFGVPAQQRAEIKPILDSTRADIVVKPFKASRGALAGSPQKLKSLP